MAGATKSRRRMASGAASRLSLACLFLLSGALPEQGLAQDPEPIDLKAELEGRSVLLKWFGKQSRHYRVEVSRDLENWETMAELIGAGKEAQYKPETSFGRAFFRLQIGTSGAVEFLIPQAKQVFDRPDPTFEWRILPEIDPTKITLLIDGITQPIGLATSWTPLFHLADGLHTVTLWSQGDAPVTRSFFVNADLGDALWVWPPASDQALTNTDRQQRLIAFCKTNHIKVIFFYAEFLTPDSWPQWQSFISNCSQARIRVEALVGDADWLTPTGWWDLPQNQRWGSKADRADALDTLARILNYQVQAPPEQRFSGVHLDVEIHASHQLLVDPNGNLVTEAQRILFNLELIEDLSQARASAGLAAADLPFHWDIAMHYDLSGFARTALFYPLKETGTPARRPGWQHLFDRFEKITFLTYSDRPRGIVESMSRELAYLDSMAKAPPIRFSFEFNQSANGQDLLDLSLGDEDYAAYVNLRQYLRSVVGDRPYFKGFGHHSYNPESNGYFDDWSLRRPTQFASHAIDIDTSAEIAKSIPATENQAITRPVFLRVFLRADPAYAYNDSGSYSDMLSFLPIGLGYADEGNLLALNEIANPSGRSWLRYDGLCPKNWWFYEHVRWYPFNPNRPPTKDLVASGLCWINPATNNQPQAAVIRDLKLQEGARYRFVLAHNDSDPELGLLNFLSIAFVAINPPGPLGNDRNNPVTMTLLLGKMNFQNAKNTPHDNNSQTLFDSDADGLSDTQELFFGTDRLNPDSDRDGSSDGDEVARGDDPLSGL